MSALFTLGAALFILLFCVSLGITLSLEKFGWGFFGMGIGLIFAIICFILSYSFSMVTGTIVDINITDNFFVIQNEEEEEEQKIRIFVEDWEVKSYKEGEKYTFRRSDID